MEHELHDDLFAKQKEVFLLLTRKSFRRPSSRSRPTIDFIDPVFSKLPLAEVPSTKMSIQNTINRFIFNDRLFGNDPDVFLLRDENIRLSKEQKYALTIINALFGSVLMTSDDIATYNEYQKSVLAKALDLFKNSKVVSVTKLNKTEIKIVYENNKEIHEVVYNTKKGVLHE